MSDRLLLQLHCIHDSNIEDHLCQAMKKMMKDNQAPKEQFERIGLAE